MFHFLQYSRCRQYKRLHLECHGEIESIALELEMDQPSRESSSAVTFSSLNSELFHGWVNEEPRAARAMVTVLPEATPASPGQTQYTTVCHSTVLLSLGEFMFLKWSFAAEFEAWQHKYETISHCLHLALWVLFTPANITSLKTYIPLSSCLQPQPSS